MLATFTTFYKFLYICFSEEHSFETNKPSFGFQDKGSHLLSHELKDNYLISMRASGLSFSSI